jgi:UDP-N-acetylmuramoyl-tripeptide--D-alanyl-D-alanine ligase
LYSKSALFWLYLWQVKEYRLDRFFSEYGFLAKLLHFWFFSGGRKFHRPVFTVKALVIYITSLLIILGGIYGVLKFLFYGEFLNIWILIVGLLGLYLLVPLAVVLVMFLFQIPILLAKNLIYKMAAARVNSLKNLTVIGITGSYGKSSTKEFLAQILEKKFKVIKTPKNINTEIGIAKFILQKLNPDDQVFIVEMGAYKKGEIKIICDIVKPKIGMVTGINEQHLDLFKSFENIINTKYELIESLPKDGLAVFNGENKYCLEMAERWQGEKIVYNATKYENLRIYESLPKHYWLNLNAAIYTAKHLGMGDEETNEAVKDIKLTERMIKIFTGKNGALIIDDTYSANPAGVMAALDYLAEQKQKNKIIAMPCLIELGSAAEDVHRRIGKRIAEVCSLALITTKDYFNIIKTEAGDKAVLAFKPEKVIELLKDKLNSDTAVLLEGRLADSIVGFLK